MKSRVYFIPAHSGESPELLSSKAKQVFLRTGFLDRLEPADFAALKIHFGERGNEGYIRPLWLRDTVAAVRTKTPRVFLSDSNTLYVGARSNSVEHIKLAWSHGFRPDVLDIPVIIADGLIGHDAGKSPGNHGRVASGKIAGAFLSSDALLVLTHVTGHVQTGIGGSIKNMGMGCASRAGKLDQHSVAHPRVQAKSCRDCGSCFDHCPSGAIRRTAGHAAIDDAACLGCGECLVVCKHGAIKPRWDEDVRRIQEKVAEYALLVKNHFRSKVVFVNFLLRITKDCDCMAKAEPPIVEDIGILASIDPVAVDQASADLVLERGGRDPFRKGYDIDWSFQMRHGRMIGLGTTEYQRIELE
jgi:hypothetical protein